jgi:cytochrome c oxidase cbb3-type subunit 3
MHRLALVAAVAALGGCDTHHRAATYAPLAQDQLAVTPVSHLYPGGRPPPPVDPRAELFAKDPVHIANGKRYFTWYNCSGCHFNGGGGIGPAFMDAKWIYGGSLTEIHNSIAQGRPNGMPVWGGKIPDAQIWEIAAFVKSLSIPSADDVASAANEAPPPPVRKPG